MVIDLSKDILGRTVPSLADQRSSPRTDCHLSADKTVGIVVVGGERGTGVQVDVERLRVDVLQNTRCGAECLRLALVVAGRRPKDVAGLYG